MTRYDCLKPYLLPFTKLASDPCRLVLKAANSEEKTVEKFENESHQRFIERTLMNRLEPESRFLWNIFSINDLDVSPDTINKRKLDCLAEIVKVTDLLKPLSKIIVGYLSYWDGSIDADASRLIVESFQIRPFSVSNRHPESLLECIEEILYFRMCGSFDTDESNVKLVIFRATKEISEEFGVVIDNPNDHCALIYFSSSLEELINYYLILLPCYGEFSSIRVYMNERFVLV